jgi:hypothetical protein
MTMTTWTEAARAELERYFARIRPTLEASGADASEVIEDLRRHLDAEIASANLPVVTEQDVQRLLARIGAPEPPAVEPPRPASAETSANTAPAPAKPGMFVSGLLLFAGVILPLITLALELATRMCAGAFFDPLPTFWNILLVAFVPVANLLAWNTTRQGRAERRVWLGWVNGAAIGVAGYYAFLFLPLLLPGIIAVFFFGWGLLPWSPMLSLIAAVGLRRHVRRLGPNPEAVLPGFWRGLGLGLLALALIEAPGIATKVGLQMAASESPQEQRTGLRWLRSVGREETMLRACYGFTRGAQQMDIMSSLLGGANRLPAEKAREIYYRVIGQLFNSVPAPEVRSARGAFADLNEWTWDEDHGGDKVGGRIKGLALHSSRLDTLVDATGVWTYSEWTLEFKNVSEQDREARAQILLPPGGVVSRLTLWVNGEEREAAFAGRSHVREAYQKVAVQQRRDPVLVTTAGPDRVLVQCFPVPRRGGLMKVRLGITAPLTLTTPAEGIVRLPCLLERNFNLQQGFKHSVWVGGAGEIKTRGTALTAEAAESGRSALRGLLANGELASPASLLKVARNPKQLAAWTKDTRGPNEQFIRQTLESVPAQRPARIVFVVDGSRAMAPHLAAVADAVSTAAAAKMETLVLVAADEVAELNNADSSLRHFKAHGGQDNVPALLRAWNLAALKPSSAIVWLHAPQPVLLDSTEALTQALERAGHGAPQLFELQTEPGPDRVLEKLDGFSHVHPVLRTDGLAQDLNELIRSWQTARPQIVIHRTARDTEAAAREGGAQETELHLARLWAADEVRRLRAERKNEEAIQLAARHQLVTPVSGAVVLQNQQQYAQTGLRPVDAQTVPAIPEPSASALLGLGAAALWLLRRRQQRATRSPVLAGTHRVEPRKP